MAYADPAVSTSNPSYICYAAVSYEKTGQSKKADAALISVSPSTYVDCLPLSRRHSRPARQLAQAQQWYTKAIKLAPSIPSGYYRLGHGFDAPWRSQRRSSSICHGQPERSPLGRPLKAWGDVLMKQGKTQEAQEKFTEALKYAPNWKELKEALKAGTTH